VLHEIWTTIWGQVRVRNLMLLDILQVLSILAQQADFQTAEPTNWRMLTAPTAQVSLTPLEPCIGSRVVIHGITRQGPRIVRLYLDGEKAYTPNHHTVILGETQTDACGNFNFSFVLESSLPTTRCQWLRLEPGQIYWLGILVGDGRNSEMYPLRISRRCSAFNSMFLQFQ
jgi:hypothetical protein